MITPISLRIRLVLLVFVALSPLFAVSVFKAINSTHIAIERATNNLRTAASLVAINQNQVTESVRHVLTAISQMPDIGEGHRTRCARYLIDLNRQFTTFANFGIINADGYTRCHGVASAPTEMYLGDRSYFRDAIARRSFVAGEFTNGRLSKKPSLLFALPVVNKDDHVTFVAYAALDLSEMAHSIEAMKGSKDTDVEILDRKGILLFDTSKQALLVGEKTVNPVLLEAVKILGMGVSEGIDSSGKQRIWAFKPSQPSVDTAFFVAVSIPREAVVGPIKHQFNVEMIALSLMVLLGGAIAWLMGGRVLMQPIGEILKATNLVKKGQMNQRIALDQVGPSTEFAEIARGFNLMADSLQQRELDFKTELARTRQAQEALEELQDKQVKSYAKLHDTQSKLLDATRLGGIGHWEMDLNTRSLSWSEGMYSLYGLEPDTFNGEYETFMRMFHPEDRSIYEKNLEIALRDGSPLDSEYRIITPAGDIRWLHQIGKLYIDENGRSVCRSGVVQDITERKRIDIELAKNIDLLRRTGQMSVVGGWEYVLDTKRLSYSEELLKIYDMAPDEVLSIKSVIDSYEPQVRPVFVSAVQAAIDHGATWDLELPMMTKAGRRVWVRTQGQALLRDGKVYRLAGAVQDNTAQHESREHLDLLENSIARLNDMVFITKVETIGEGASERRIVFVNKAFERHTGYSSEEAIGKTLQLMHGPKTDPAELDRIAIALKTGKPIRLELINYTKSGAEFWSEVDIASILDRNGLVTHAVSVARDVTQRKLAEQSLIDSEQRYGALFEAAPVPMWILDPQTLKFMAVNEICISRYGYSREEFLAMTLFDILTALEAERLRAKTIQEARDLGNRCVHRCKDGTELFIEMIAHAVSYNGKASHFVVAFDVTAQVIAEQKLQEYMFTLQRAADAAQAITWHQKLDGMLKEFADQARGVIGAHQAVVTLTVGGEGTQVVTALSLSDKYAKYREWVEPIDGSGIYQIICETNRAVRLTQAELEAHPRWRGFGSYADKHPVMRGWLAIPLISRKGENIGILQLSDKCEGEFTQQDEYIAIELSQLASVAIENVRLLEEVGQLNFGLEEKVTERTAALVRQEALFRALADQAPHAIWTIDPSGAATYFNREWFNLMGGKLKDWTGNKWLGIVHPEDLPDVKAHWQTARLSQTFYESTRRLRAANGRYHSMSSRATPVFDDDGEVAFWVGIDVDISEIKAIEAALRLSNKELEAFSYSVSHDLRSPLNTIDGFSRLLSKHLGNDLNEKGRHYLSRIQAGAGQMGKLIEDLLSLAQVSRVQVRAESVNLTAMSQELLEDWQASHPERQVTFNVENSLTAHGDSRLVRVVIENLLSNAWKFTSRNVIATITVGKKLDITGAPIFFIRDNGAGFDMAYIDKLFIAFNRLHTVTEFPGTGIGLAAASRAIGRHGGRLWAESSIGNGATFFFTLPVSLFTVSVEKKHL